MFSRKSKGLVVAVYAVAQAGTFGWWIYSVIATTKHYVWTKEAVIALAVLAVGAIVWGIWQRQSPGNSEVHHHHYAAPVTQVMNPARDASYAPAVSLTMIESADEAREVVQLALRWLVENDGYSIQQLRENLLDDILADLAEEGDPDA